MKYEKITNKEEVKSKYRRKKIGSLRRGKLINTYGPGAIVDFLNHTVMIAGIEYWNYGKNGEDKDKYEIHEEHLEKCLDKKYFLLPPVPSQDLSWGNDFSKDVQSVIFPKIYVCKKCGKIDRYERFKDGKQLKCYNCGSKKNNIVPSEFVIACEKGHISDFPYWGWVHQDNNNDEEKCKVYDKLFLEINNNIEGLASHTVICKACGRSRSLRGILGSRLLENYVCPGYSPWLKKREEESCNNTLTVLQKSATNVYFCNIESALSIPPWSKRVNQILNDKKVKYALEDYIEDKDWEGLKRVIERKKIDEQCDLLSDDIVKFIKSKDAYREDKEPITINNIKEKEYKSFQKGYSDDDEIDFLIERTEIDESLNKYINDIILVKKLREVQVITGFSRINPNNQIAPISKDKKIDWLPAIELRGEGVFIEFNEEMISKWEKNINVQKRFKILQDNIKNSEKYSYIPNLRNVNSRYILLHTISHLLIKQLSMDSGYSSNDLKERIYCTIYNDEYNKSSSDMCGILIYTSSADSEGSLGGLVDSGKKERFTDIFKKAIESAKWCSSDPLCIQSKGQGINGLNLAACHSCTLIGDISCESRNMYLDRGLVVGTLEDISIGFFNEDLY